jgi:competence protein ComEC
MSEPLSGPLGQSQAARPYQPLVPAAGALVAGILVGEYAGGGMLVWCGLALAAALAWGAGRRGGVRDRWLLVPLLVLVAVAGAGRYRASVDPPPDDVARLAAGGSRLVTLEGIVARSVRQTSPPDDVFLPGMPHKKPGALVPDGQVADRQVADGRPGRDKPLFYIHSTLTLACERALVDGRWTAAQGKVQAIVREAIPQGGGVPDFGDRVQAMGVLYGPGPPVNPGAYDVAAYLRTQGVRAFFHTDHWEAVRVVAPGADRLRWLLGAMQRWALARLDRLPSKEGRAVAAAMLFGRRDLLDFDTGQVNSQDIERAFLATGTVHYMAVSGFNVALVVVPLLVLARLLGLGRKATAAVIAAAVLAFAMMTELEPPVLRASILFWVICLGWLLGREPLNLNSLAATVILVLLLRPGDLFSKSFQFSFLAVIGMIFLVDRIEDVLFGRYLEVQRLRDPFRRPGFWYRGVVRGTLMVSMAATIVNIPLIASQFHLVAWLAPVASTVLFPLVFALTVGGMLLVAAGWLAPWLGDLLATVPDGLGRTISAVVKAMANVPGAYFYVPDISPAWIAIAYGLLIVWVWRRRLGVSRRHLALAALTAAAAFVWTGGHAAPGAVRATFLAVGSGNANLLELPDGRSILFDAGSAVGNARAAETTLAPALWARRVDRLDAVFLSHAHFDHFKDILPLVARFGVRQVFVPPTFPRRRLKCDKMVIEALLARGVRVEFFGAGDRLGGTGAVEVRGVWPRGPKSMTKSLNDGSLVLVVADRARRLLLTGDIGPAGIQELLEVEPDLRADAMLWPHHGHDPDAVGRLAAATGARALVVSDGRPLAPWQKPAWARERGAACFHTGQEGAVTLELRPEGLYAETFARGPAPPEPETDADEDPDLAED